LLNDLPRPPLGARHDDDTFPQGLSCGRRIHHRSRRDQKQIVVVTTTSEDHVSKVSEALAAGANKYLVKPCDTPKLRQRLQRALMRPLGG
jgi:PleD family two-component response regulator